MSTLHLKSKPTPPLPPIPTSKLLPEPMLRFLKNVVTLHIHMYNSISGVEWSEHLVRKWAGRCPVQAIATFECFRRRGNKSRVEDKVLLKEPTRGCLERGVAVKVNFLCY